MVSPLKIFACCKNCGAVFEFIKTENGDFVEAPKEVNDADVGGDSYSA